MIPESVITMPGITDHDPGIGDHVKSESVITIVRNTHYRRPLVLEMPQNAGNTLRIGKTMLTRIGNELAVISGSKPVEGFWEYVKDQWKEYLPKSQTQRTDE